jgi:hypothetical protein
MAKSMKIPKDDLRLLITPLVSSNIDHCVLRPSLICVFWLLLWYLQTFGHCVLCHSLICVFWLNLWQWPKVWRYQRVNQKTKLDEGQRTQWPKVWKYQRSNQKTQIDEGQRKQWPKFEDINWYLQTFGHCVLCPSSICVFWLNLWYPQTLDNKRFNQKTQINEGQRTQWSKVWRYQSSNQKTQINEGRRTQWTKFEDTKGLIRQTLLRGLPSERTKTSNRGGYRQTLLRGLPSDQTTTKPQEIKRENLQTLHERGTSSGRPESIKQLSKIHQ